MPPWDGTPWSSSGFLDSGLFNSSSLSPNNSLPPWDGTPWSSSGLFNSLISSPFLSSGFSGFSSVSLGCFSSSITTPFVFNLLLSSFSSCNFGSSWVSTTVPNVSGTFWESSLLSCSSFLLFLLFLFFFFFLQRLSKLICIKQSPLVTNFTNFL